MAVNLTGPMRLIKAVAPVMKAHGRGRIVNVASVAGLGPMGSSDPCPVTPVEPVAIEPHAPNPLGTPVAGVREIAPRPHERTGGRFLWQSEASGGQGWAGYSGCRTGTDGTGKASV
jgi:NAD(P)-dependent dehydrogenase (short-subunit alcohol dehydrogenase family)